VGTGTFVSDGGGEIDVIDVATWQRAAATMPIANPGWIVVAPDGKTALVGSLYTPDLFVVDVPGLTLRATLTTYMRTSGIATDGKQIVAYKDLDGTLMAMPVPTSSWADQGRGPIPVTGRVLALAMMPEGAFAMLGTGAEPVSAVFKTAEQKLETSPVPALPPVVMSSDGSVALVRFGNGQTVMLVDPQRRQRVTVNWTGTPDIAVAPGAVVEIRPDSVSQFAFVSVS
jgi:hypothetical protein